MSRETDRLLEQVRDVLRDIDRLAHRLLDHLFSLPATIVFTDPQGVPVTTVSLTGNQTATVPVLVGDVNGDPIAGDILDPGASVSVGDPTVCSAVLSADQTSLAVTALDTTSTTTVTVSGTFGGATLTPGNLTVDTTASTPPPPPPPVAAEVVFGTPVVEGATAAAPAAPAAPADAIGSGHGSEAGGQAPA